MGNKLFIYYTLKMYVDNNNNIISKVEQDTI